MLIWIYAAIAGYFLSACSKVLDKIILARAIPDPIVFTVFAGLLSGFVVILMPFGFSFISGSVFVLSLAAGMCVLASLYFLYSALQVYDASRVVPLVVSMSPFITLGLSFLFLQNTPTAYELYAFLFLIVGGLLLSFNPRTTQKIKSDLLLKSFIAGLFLSGSLVFTKLVFTNTLFINGVIWTRLGIFISAILLLIFPRVRKAMSTAPRLKVKYGSIFVTNKIIGALGLLSINYAISIGSPALVNALGSFEYLFIFLLSIALTIIAPRLLREDISRSALALKLSGSLALGVSLFFLFYSQ
ncbi:MAG: hypothetical protein AAB783_01475 [Patescibacteria group bacterium]